MPAVKSPPRMITGSSSATKDGTVEPLASTDSRKESSLPRNPSRITPGPRGRLAGSQLAGQGPSTAVDTSAFETTAWGPRARPSIRAHSSVQLGAPGAGVASAVPP